MPHISRPLRLLAHGSARTNESLKLEGANARAAWLFPDGLCERQPHSPRGTLSQRSLLRHARSSWPSPCRASRKRSARSDPRVRIPTIAARKTLPLRCTLPIALVRAHAEGRETVLLEDQLAVEIRERERLVALRPAPCAVTITQNDRETRPERKDPRRVRLDGHAAVGEQTATEGTAGRRPVRRR